MNLTPVSKNTISRTFDVAGIPADMSDYDLENEVARLSRLAFIFDVKVESRNGSTARVTVITD